MQKDERLSVLIDLNGQIWLVSMKSVTRISRLSGDQCEVWFSDGGTIVLQSSFEDFNEYRRAELERS